MRAFKENYIAAFGPGFFKPFRKLGFFCFKLGYLSAALVFVKKIYSGVVEFFYSLFCIYAFACGKENIFGCFGERSAADAAVAYLTNVYGAFKNIGRHAEEYFAGVLTAKYRRGKLGIYYGTSFANRELAFGVSRAYGFAFYAIASAAARNDGISAC